MVDKKPKYHYKNLQEMVESPEYQELLRLIRQGCEEGIIDAHPPLPKEVNNGNSPLSILW